MGWPLRRGKDGRAVDRCALFVDAGYVLADGAMAVHGTRRAESVSWDYEGPVSYTHLTLPTTPYV